MPPILTREQIAERLAQVGYIADRDLATALLLMDLLGRPLLIEGEAGVGKTEVAKALADVHATNLIRLQCYEGLDQSAALYEWNYQRQLLAIKAREGDDADEIEAAIFSERYLLERPLLAAIRQDVPPVLLIDEIDRADEEFEAFLLELLSDFQVSIPELGTIVAQSHTARRADIQRHARIVRRAAAALPVPPPGLPDAGPRGAHHPHPRARHRGLAGTAGGRNDCRPSARGAGEAARRGGDAGLGSGAARAWRRRPGRRSWP